MSVKILEAFRDQITSEMNGIQSEPCGSFCSDCSNPSEHIRWRNLAIQKEKVDSELWNARLAQIKRQSPIKTFIINLGKKWSAERDEKLWELAGDK